MDADLQDSPDALPALFYAWKNGAKTAVVERGKRAEKGAVFFKVFYWLLHRVSRTLPPISFGSHSILDRTVVHRLRSFTESNRYFPGLVALSSPDIVSIRRNREPRRHGTSRVGFFGLVNLAITALLSFSNAPVRLVSLLGIVCALGGFGMGAAIIGIKLLTSKAIPGWASMMTLIAFGSGLQLLCLGLIGEYVARIYDEVKGRPLYWVDSLSSDVNTSRAFGQNRKKEVA
jgi:glycosyltransferase involved in cell wall biosynthesis